MSENIPKRNKRQNNWQKNNKERINILYDKGTKERIKAAAEKANISTSELVRQAINEKLEQLENNTYFE
ncbi:Ribbon-helix-helix protein, copG family [Butyrivibrio fibrisolvens]|uniref:Ribbon-helix-helix protein, copG family n=1 Tax=Butyrivibrio fibrisolvens TaxID=831 RepID=A0A1H9QSG0_BUTFI|nr:CopG family transcriptional regulator [Butyrivibrio fibrisolvens]SER63175.1 Ribbon-helix-helix protein, copG family [Butyrivibrio fibrisolvens]